MDDLPMTDRLESAVRELVDALRSEIAPPADSPDRLLSVDEAAAALGVGRSLLYSEMGAGRLRSIRVGKRRLIPSRAVTEYSGIAD